MSRRALHRSQRRVARPQGVAAIEFALVSTVFFMLLIGAMEVGRVLFVWNTTGEATRLGARLAVVCDIGDAEVKARMTALFPVLTANDIDVSYLPAACTVSGGVGNPPDPPACQTVTVTIEPGKSIPTFIPFAALNLTLPPFTTTLSRESMQSAAQNGTPNPVCQ